MRLRRRPMAATTKLPESEKRIALKEFGARLNPRRPYATVWKWCKVGYNGIRLEFERQAGLIFTSVEAGERFLERTGQL